MGTSAKAAIHRLDYDRWCAEVAPALCRLVAERSPDEPLPAWLLGILSAHDNDARALLEAVALRDGLSLSVLGNCERLGPDLGLRDNDTWLLAAVAQRGGACPSRGCAEADRCPLHMRGQSPVTAGTFARVIGAAFETCLSEPLEVGSSLGFEAFVEWYALEREPYDVNWLDWDESRWLDEVEQSPLLGLLLRLGKRGTLLLTGAGNGVLGWLTPRETFALTNALDGVLLAPSAKVSESLARYSAYAAENELPAARRYLASVLATAREAAKRHQGMALSRRQ
jgi:hypothetical protein